MLEIKLLEADNINLARTGRYEKYKLALNNVLNKEVEIVHSQDDNFDGYYIVPIEGYSPQYFSDKIIAKKSFLVAMEENHLDYYLEMNLFAGFSNFRDFMAVNPTVFARVDVLQQQNVDKSKYALVYQNYAWYNAVHGDNTFETMVKNHLSYLEVYDKYLKSNG